MWTRIFCKGRLPRRTDEDGLEEATAAKNRADKALNEIRGQTLEIAEISRKMRRLRERNSFAEMITSLFGGAP